jgi:hyperosmotically inducible periplasmic protein
MYTKSRNLILASGIALVLAGVGGAAADTVSQDVTDARQETQIWTTYALSPYLRDNDLKVSVHNGKATLTGKVEDSVDKDLAKQIALGVDGVEEVDNKIVIDADYIAPARPQIRTYGETIDDATITAAVKSKLLWSKYTSGLTTEVGTRSGKVTLQGTLSGKVDSEAERTLAIELAQTVRGVKSVQSKALTL